MLDYSDTECIHCQEKTVVYLQYVGDAKCESCGEWQEPEE